MTAPENLGSPRLEADGLTKRYKGRLVLDDVTLRVAPGAFVAILGPSGAGKTTLFRCLTGLTAPDRGSVRIDGVAVPKDAGRARRRVAVVFQHYNLVRRLSTLDNVLAGRLGHVPAWQGITRCFSRKDRLRALACLDRVGLLPFATARADTLSGGQQQRVAIARALAQEAEMIIADEPIASLDPTAAAGVLDLLRGIAHEEGVSVVCSLHQTHFARSHSDRIIGLAAGRVVFDGRAQDFDEAAAIRLYATPRPEPETSTDPGPLLQDAHP